MEFNFEFHPRLQAHPLGIGVANQQVAVAMDPGAEVSLPAFWPAGSRRTGGKDVTLGSYQGPVKAFFNTRPLGPTYPQARAI